MGVVGELILTYTHHVRCIHTSTHSSTLAYLFQRAPLESVILHIKKLDLGEPCAILSLALQPPNLFDIQRAIINLKEVRC